MEKGKVTHSIILAWRIPWTEKPGRLQIIGFCKELDTTEQLTFSGFFSLFFFFAYMRAGWDLESKVQNGIILY